MALPLNIENEITQYVDTFAHLTRTEPATVALRWLIEQLRREAAEEMREKCIDLAFEWIRDWDTGVGDGNLDELEAKIRALEVEK